MDWECDSTARAMPVLIIKHLYDIEPVTNISHSCASYMKSFVVHVLRE